MYLRSVSVVVPALNEVRNIPYVFGSIPPEIHEIILVDGFSVCDTVEVVHRRPDVCMVEQRRPGKVNAFACGLRMAIGDIIVPVDADASADTGKISRFVESSVSPALATGPRAGERLMVTALDVERYDNRFDLVHSPGRLPKLRCYISAVIQAL
jgi:glycosyltransferase involved in cell wall biosynthesis